MRHPDRLSESEGKRPDRSPYPLPPSMLAPIESSEAFLATYQDVRGRLFTAVEQEIAWAASVWMATYNAREQALFSAPQLSGDALRTQAAATPPPG